MSESLRNERRGITADGLRVLALVCLTMGVIGKTVVENRMLGMANKTAQELLKLLENPDMMGLASIALVLQVIYYCAVPIFAFLLVEGVGHSKNLLYYFLRLLGLALVSELPYNLAAGDKLWDTTTRNPVFALVLGFVMLYLYRNYAEKSWKNFSIKALVTLMAVLWVGMLRIEQGLPVVILAAALWALRGKSSLRVIGGCSAAIACSLVSPLYMASPLIFIAVHFYNGQQGEGKPWLRYGAYPAILLGVYAAAKLM